MSARRASALRVKICGVRDPETAALCAEEGAAYVGLVFFPPSPRAVTPAAAAEILAALPPETAGVALFVDPTDAEIEAALRLAPAAFLQLHGEETPDRVRAVRRTFGLPVIKAVGVSDIADLAPVDGYEAAADMLLCDAKPAPGAAVPGGAGVAFEQRLLSGRNWFKPWLLAGGLTAETLGGAVAACGARQVDVSSGVESARGVKSPERICAFMAAAREIRIDGRQDGASRSG